MFEYRNIHLILIYLHVLRLGRRATPLWKMPELLWSFTKWWRWSGRSSWPPNPKAVHVTNEMRGTVAACRADLRLV